MRIYVSDDTAVLQWELSLPYLYCCNTFMFAWSSYWRFLEIFNIRYMISQFKEYLDDIQCLLPLIVSFLLAASICKSLHAICIIWPIWLSHCELMFI